MAFDKDIDCLDFFARQNDGDQNNDGVYLVDIESGIPVPLDVNSGHFPLQLNDSDQYFRNDPNRGVSNIYFPIDGHFTSAGNRLYAQAFADVLKPMLETLRQGARSTHESDLTR